MAQTEIRGPQAEQIEPALPALASIFSELAGTPVEFAPDSWAAISIDSVPTSKSRQAITIATTDAAIPTQLHIGLRSDDMVPHDERAWLIAVGVIPTDPEGPSVLLFLGRGQQKDIPRNDWHKIAEARITPDRDIAVRVTLPENKQQQFELAAGTHGNLSVLTGQNHWDALGIGLDEFHDEFPTP